MHLCTPLQMERKKNRTAKSARLPETSWNRRQPMWNNSI